jgi:hypothetical protein
MRRRLGGLQGRELLLALAKSALATLAMGIGLWAWLGRTAGEPVWLVVLGGVVLGAAIYGAMALILGVREARTLAGTVLRKVQNR